MQRGTETFPGVGNAFYLDCDDGDMTISHFETLSNDMLMGESFVSMLHFNKPGEAGEKKKSLSFSSFTYKIFYSDKVYWAIMKSLL